MTRAVALGAFGLWAACASSGPAQPKVSAEANNTAASVGVETSQPMRADGGETTRAPGNVAPAVPAPPTAIAVGSDNIMQTTHVSEKEWIAGVRDKLAQRFGVPPADLVFSAGRTLVAFIRGPADTSAHPRTRRRRSFKIDVVEPTGKSRGSFAAIGRLGSDEPPKDLRFLSEDSLVYEVAVPAPPPAPPPTKSPKTDARKGRAHARSRVPPRSAHASTDVDSATVFSGEAKRLFVVQPVRRHARPIRCEGVGFAFTTRRDQLAFVGGTPAAAFVGVNGARTYPRRGRTVIMSDPVWSKDGRSLAFLETARGGSARLVLLVEPDNPTGDTTWALPASAQISGARVFWAGPGKLVVGKTALHPLFAASFTREQASTWDP